MRVADYDWLVLTEPKRRRVSVPLPEGDPPRVAAIGRGTADALVERGVEPVVARESTQEGFVAVLLSRRVAFCSRVRKVREE